MNTVKEAIERVRLHAVQISKDDTRTVSKHVVGTVQRQGDVYIHHVAADFPVGKTVAERQIAEGTSLGARHILKGHCKVYECNTLPDYMDKKTFAGMVQFAFDVMSEGCTLTHPEHGDYAIEAAGRYVVTYQMDARTRQRVLD